MTIYPVLQGGMGGRRKKGGGEVLFCMSRRKKVGKRRFWTARGERPEKRSPSFTLKKRKGDVFITSAERF